MADAKTFTIDGTDISIIDETARERASAALESAEYNRLSLVGKYPGQDLATVLSAEIGSGENVYDALHARVQDADFSGLRVGDYIDVPLVSASAVTTMQSVRFILAHIDPYYRCGDQMKGHHIAFVASRPIEVASGVTGYANDGYLMWNTTNTNQGNSDEASPYLVSNLKKWENLFEGCLPEGLSKYLLTQRVLAELRYSSGGSITDSTEWDWRDIGKVFSLSETEVYGQCVWGTKGWSVGFDCQWDYFRDTAHRQGDYDDETRVTWWLRSVGGGSSSGVCCVNGNGNASYYAATNGRVRPRPGFLLG